MKKFINLLIITLVSIWASSCVEKYWPEINETYLDLLVVDGSITNKPGPYTIRLSNSSSVNYPKSIPLSGYYVEIQDSEGNSEILSELSPGTYQTNPNGIQGIVGRSYKLIIRNSSKNYESNFEKLLQAVEIKDVYSEFQVRQDTSMYQNLQGYQFFVDSEEMDSDTTFILYKLQQTYEYRANMRLGRLYENRRFYRVHNPDSLRTCWRTHNRDELFTFKSYNSKGESIQKFPIHYVNNKTKELSVRYSVLVQQMRVNKRAYQYYTGLNDQNNGDGSFYVQQPYQLRANIYNTDEPNEIVLGYFNVAGVSEKRVYQDRALFELLYDDTCFVNTEDVGRLRWTSPAEWPIYLTITNNGGIGIVDQYCVDCREEGGELTPPSFWIDN